MICAVSPRVWLARTRRTHSSLRQCPEHRHSCLCAQRSCTPLLAAQLYSEFKQFFPRNAVEYFVSYFDYYQPEAYIPRSDTYIEKDSSINEEIERLRLSATSALLSRRDVIVVASVSCIYGITSPEDYLNML